MALGFLLSVSSFECLGLRRLTSRIHNKRYCIQSGWLLDKLHFFVVSSRCMYPQTISYLLEVSRTAFP